MATYANKFPIVLWKKNNKFWFWGGGGNTDTNPVWTGIEYGHTPRRGCGGRGWGGDKRHSQATFPKSTEFEDSWPFLTFLLPLEAENLRIRRFTSTFHASVALFLTHARACLLLTRFLLAFTSSVFKRILKYRKFSRSRSKFQTAFTSLFAPPPTPPSSPTFFLFFSSSFSFLFSFLVSFVFGRV
jgi:hypothetical protein